MNRIARTLSFRWRSQWWADASLFVVCFSFLLCGGQEALAYSRGVNLPGLGWAGSVLPGVFNTAYNENSEADYQYFGGKGMNLIRLPIIWERIQPVLNGPLNTTYLGYVQQNLTWAAAHGDRVIIDVHNYGEYAINSSGTYTEYPIGSTQVPIADYAYLWTLLSNQFASNSTVYAYDLMNEPANISAATWHSASQAAVSAIRSNGDTSLIMVEGAVFAGAASWTSDNLVGGSSAPWITDTANNMKYSAHLYFDSNSSGTYSETYDQELAANSNLATVGATRLAPFVTWCQTYGVNGYLGEFGIPNNDIRWNTVLDNFLFALDAAGFDGTQWAGGDWWGNNLLSIEPANTFTLDAPDLAVLIRHPGTGNPTLGEVSIDCGGGVSSPYLVDNDFSGGSVSSTSATISTTGVTNPAPQAVYQSSRQGASTYTIVGLTAGVGYTVRLHFSENNFTASGQRVFNVAINGTQVLTNFDIYAAAGGANKAVVKQYTGVANGSGQVVIAFTNVTNSAQINGIQVYATPIAPVSVVAVPASNSTALYWTASSAPLSYNNMWTDNPSAVSYNVYRSTSSSGSYVKIGTSTTGTYIDSGLSTGTPYYYAVTMVDAIGESGYSTQVSSTPPSPPSGNAHSGSIACVATTTGSSWASFEQVPTVAQNTNYVASFWLKGTGGVVFRVYAGNNQTQLVQVVCNATSTWQQFSVPFNTGSNTQMSFVFMDGAGSAGTSYIDDCFMGAPGGTNVLTNGTFESGQTGWPNAAPTFAIQAITSVNVHAGLDSLKAVMTSTPTWSGFGQLVNCSINTNYVARLWIKGSGNVYLEAAAGSWGTTINSVECSATGSWQQVSIPFNSGSNTSVTFGLYDIYGVAGTAYIDDCFLGTSGGSNLLSNPGFESGSANWGNGNTTVWNVGVW